MALQEKVAYYLYLIRTHEVHKIQTEKKQKYFTDKRIDTVPIMTHIELVLVTNSNNLCILTETKLIFQFWKILYRLNVLNTAYDSSNISTLLSKDQRSICIFRFKRRPRGQNKFCINATHSQFITY